MSTGALELCPKCSGFCVTLRRSPLGRKGDKGPSWSRAMDLNEAVPRRFLRKPPPLRPPSASASPTPAPSASPQCLYGGVLRGTGRQAFGAVVNAVTYYVIGLPLGVVLTFVVGLGITGTWSGGRRGAPGVIRRSHRPVSCRPLAGHAGLCLPGRRGLRHLHRLHGLEAGCGGGECRPPKTPGARLNVSRHGDGAVSAAPLPGTPPDPQRKPQQPDCQRPD